MRAVDRLSRIGEAVTDLLVQFCTVRNDGHACFGIIGQYPAREEDHRDRFTRPLRMPNDAAFIALHIVLRGFDTKILIMARDFLNARIKEDKVPQQFYDAVLITKLE